MIPIAITFTVSIIPISKWQSWKVQRTGEVSIIGVGVDRLKTFLGPGTFQAPETFFRSIDSIFSFPFSPSHFPGFFTPPVSFAAGSSLFFTLCDAILLLRGFHH